MQYQTGRSGNHALVSDETAINGLALFGLGEAMPTEEHTCISTLLN